MTVLEEMSNSVDIASGQIMEEESLEAFCKQMLKTRVFQGIYQERRYVDSLKGYRDLVVLDRNETELKGDLKYILFRLTNFFRNPDLWIGITLEDMIGTPAGTCIWTELEDAPFGKYWFQIKSVRFKNNEIYIKLKPLRLVNADATSSAPYTQSSQEICNEGLNWENLAQLLTEWKQAISTSIMTFLWNDINRENIVATLRFISVLALSLLTGALELIKFLGFFTIRLFVEGRMLLHTATPIILKIIEMISKVIGGILIVLSMIWRDLICGLRGKNVVAPPPRIMPSTGGYQPIAGRSFYGSRPKVF